jgi:hypothetical protein
MDEAGGVSYQRPDKSRFFVRAAVLVRENQIGTYQEVVKAICSDFPTRNGKELLFHTHRIFHGHDGWEQWVEQRRRELLTGMAELLIAENVPIVYACVDKKKMVEKYKKPINPHLMTFIQCGEMVERWTHQHARENMWIPCVGSNDFNREIEELFVSCRRFGSPFGWWERKWDVVMDVIAFTSPEKSNVFLLSDLCAWVFSRERQGKDSWGLYDVLRPLVFAHKLFPR